MKEDNKVLLIVLMIFFTVFLSMCIFIDSDSNNGESVTMIFLNLINVLVMGLLTYLLLETSQKSNETNELLTKHTIHIFNSEQIKLMEYDNHKIRRYMYICKSLNKLFIQYLSYEEKYIIIASIVNDTMENYKYINVYNIDEIKNKISNQEEIEMEQYFHDCKVKQEYKVKDVMENWETLKDIKNLHLIKLAAPLDIKLLESIKNIDQMIYLELKDYDKNTSMTNVDIGEDNAKELFSNLININSIFEIQLKNNYEDIDKFGENLNF